ncbi:hypothetical protein PF003_g8702 [Phytophthora fragariae]|nr:hypothetical protein PF003_g8702 [Phytophthora fragariae]
MKWNAAKGGGILKLSDCDMQGRSSLILACEGGHTRLALRLLDEEFAMQNHPLRVLEAAISTDNEMHAMAICEHPKVEAAIRASDISRYKGYSGLVHTVSTYTEHAVRRGMSDVVLLLDDLNHQKVCKAVWHCTQKMHTFEGIEDIVHPGILRVAGKFLRDWRWAQVKRFFLLRYRGQDSEIATPKLQSYLLVRLPDELFCLTIDFLKPRGFHDAMKGLPFSPMTGRCECIEASFFAYPWHT